MARSKPDSTPTTPPQTAPLAAVIDELGSLEKELAPWKTKIDRVEMLRKQIRAAHDQSPAAIEIQAHGTRFVAILGPRGNQTIIDFPGLVKRIKAAAYARFATCTLAALQAHVAPDVAGAVTRIAQTGPRSLKVLEKGTPA